MQVACIHMQEHTPALTLAALWEISPIAKSEGGRRDAVEETLGKSMNSCSCQILFPRCLNSAPGARALN